MATLTARPEDGDAPKKGGIVLDVFSQVDMESVNEAVLVVRNAVTGAIRDAAQDILSGLTLTADERQALAAYRSRREAMASAAHAHIERSLYGQEDG